MAARNSGGYAFEREVRSGGETFGIHIRKIPITKYASFAKDGIYDFFSVYNGTAVGIECKASHTESSFPFDRVEPHQILALKQLHENGGQGYILINTRLPRHQKAYALSLPEYLRLRKYYAETGRKSLPLEILERLPQLEKVKGSGWDIRKLFLKETYNETTDTTPSPSTRKSVRRSRKVDK